jgi:hypothetical protein
MMSDLDRGHRDARNDWRTPFQFEPTNGGLGIFFSVTTTSQRAALIGDGFTIMVTNDGYYSAHLALGDETVVATSAHMILLPGVTQCLTLKPEDAVTHAAVITRAAEDEEEEEPSTSIQITRGNGA